MSLKPTPIEPVPEQTAQIARAAFPTGNAYLKLRDELGTLYGDEDFAKLFPRRGQPALPPWRLALVTILQFRENLSDRQAAQAVRARIDWKYLLGLELSDPGFNFSVLCEFRARLIAGSAGMQLLETMLGQFRAQGLLKAGARQRTDSTHVLSSTRTLGRLELVGETLRAALNEIATLEPQWLQGVTPPAWHERYDKRVEDTRLPRLDKEREQYARTVGEDGFTLLTLLEAPTAPPALTTLPKVAALRTAWARHFEREISPISGGSPGVRWKTNREVAQAPEKIESPYDTEARYRSKSAMHWTGFMVHLSETCEDDSAHLITHVHTTTAEVHEAMCTRDIHAALRKKDLLPAEHFVDAAYISAELLVESRANDGVDLIGPARVNPNWQTKVEGAYTGEQFPIDWDKRVVHCPQGVASAAWYDCLDKDGKLQHHKVHFPKRACSACHARALCTKAKQAPRQLLLHPQAQHEALRTARQRLSSEEGWKLYARRAGVEGTLSQAVRAFGLRRTRYRGLAKTSLQHVATAAAVNVERITAWLSGQPLAKTRTSRFAELAT
jgi:transposase